MINSNVINYDKFFWTLWNLAKNLLEVMGSIWDWLIKDLRISIPFLDGVGFSVGPWDLGFTTIGFKFDLGEIFSFNVGYSPIELLGAGLLVLIGLWIVKKLIPLG